MERKRLLALALSAACAQRVAPVTPVDASGEVATDATTVDAGCASGDDCDDGVACTADQCRAGVCAHLPLDARCGDGDRCDATLGCVDPRCPGTQRACPVRGGALRCVDTSRDADHCGACERPCANGERCAAGACVRERGGVGARCGADGDCAAGLACDDARNGMCTRACDDLGDDDAAEAMQCGGEDLRCVRGETGPACLVRCDPLARVGTPGACRVGEVCTGAWWLDPRFIPDAPGCVRWCSTDAECAGDPRGPRCNPRLGRCAQVGEDRALRPDGYPCDPRETVQVPGETEPRSAQCRGFCAAVAGDGTRGLCGSLVDRARFSRCPDDGFVVTQRGPFGADNLALCLWRTCRGDCECPDGLLCLYPEAQGTPVPGPTRYCAYPSAAQPTGVRCSD